MGPGQGHPLAGRGQGGIGVAKRPRRNAARPRQGDPRRGPARGEGFGALRGEGLGERCAYCSAASSCSPSCPRAGRRLVWSGGQLHQVAPRAEHALALPPLAGHRDQLSQLRKPGRRSALFLLRRRGPPGGTRGEAQFCDAHDAQDSCASRAIALLRQGQPAVAACCSSPRPAS